MNCRRRAIGIALVPALLYSATSAYAQRRDAHDEGDLSSTQKEIERQAKGMGPWDQNQPIIEQATDDVFAQQGWNSEPDRYARELIREVDRLPPWQQHERQAILMNSLQARYGLSEQQKTLFDQEFQNVGMQIGMKHFARLAPVAMDVIRTRSKGEPFTPEQVAGWMQQLSPVMADAKTAMEQMSRKVGATLSDEQRKIFDKDVEALYKRHGDMEKMVEKWKQGQWTPLDWGLRNDPIHQVQVNEALRRDLDKTNRVEAQTFREKPSDAMSKATQESTWEKYVRNFCVYYECDARQKAQAFAILADEQKEAVKFRQAHRAEIEKAEKLAVEAETPERKQFYAKETDRLLAPIAEQFERLKARLDTQILTTQQRQLKDAKQTKS